MRIALVLAFESLPAAALPYVGDVVGHIPKHWDVCAAERECVKQLMSAAPGRVGSILMFSSDAALVTGAAQRQRLLDVLQELERRVDGKALLLQDTAATRLSCVAAYAGDYEDVVDRVARATQDPLEMRAREFALSGLVSHPDPDVVTFALLAQDSLSVASNVDWRAVEAQYMLCSEGVVSPEKVYSVLSAHSPGATSKLRLRQLQNEVMSINKITPSHAADVAVSRSIDL